ncbi:Cysteine desulfuration protein SufE [termite gut metagenome]|uniref:Cysteine desulfuration protein SufE n=1 Tax=termite gut metagenome TaxID=433724 RepID=A0A5J4SQH3_9ZZZZ
MTVQEKQNNFVEEMSACEEWHDKFNLLIGYFSEQTQPAPPAELIEYRIEGCFSRTYFRAFLSGGKIHTNGWSGSAVMGGIIVAISKMFHESPASEWQDTAVDFHIRTELIKHLTPMRQAALTEMINRIESVKHKA